MESNTFVLRVDELIPLNGERSVNSPYMNFLAFASLVNGGLTIFAGSSWSKNLVQCMRTSMGKTNTQGR